VTVARWLGVCALAIAGAARAAAADPTADSEFKRGRELLKAGKFADACAAFAASDKLDPELGTQFNIAQCDEKIGKPVEALRIYRDLAVRDPNADRRKAAGDRTRELAAHVAKLRVQLQLADARPPDLAITLDGADVTAQAVGMFEVDPGTHVIATSATGFAPTHVDVEVPAQAVVVPVVIVIQRQVGAEVVPPSAPPSAPPATVEPPAVPVRPAAVVVAHAPPHRGHRGAYAVAAIIGGVAIAGAGLVVGAHASSLFDTAQQQCPATACSGPQAALANQTVDSARTFGDLSTGLVVGGAVVLAVGVVVFATRPHAEPRVSMQLGAHDAGVAYSVRF
jgi:hypothetical protein